MRVLACILLLSLSVASAAQEPASPESKAPESTEGHERILGVVPAFSVTNRQNAPPLSRKQKFVLFTRQTYDPFQWIIVGVQAGIGQATNSFPAYGQGAAGYGKRYGAAFADATTSGFFSNFAYPVAFKQDPRYFRLGQGSVKHRLGYCLVQGFWVKSDKGKRQFGYSNVLGALTSGSISNAYYPPDDRGFGLTMSRAGISLLYGALGGLGLEFWPDIDRKLFQRNKSAKKGEP